MAGTIQPIAALTSEDFGPINTIVSIVLSVTSILIAIVRMAIRRQNFYQFEPDDIVFCAALVYFTPSISSCGSLTPLVPRCLNLDCISSMCQSRPRKA